MRLGDLDALLNEVRNNKELYERERVYLEGLLLNAPTVETVPLEMKKAMDVAVTDLFNVQAELDRVRNEKKPRGEWEEPFEHNGKIYHKCNHCHASIPFMFIDNYCSYCGADMRGKE